MYSGNSSNSEADASKLSELRDKMFSRYYMDSDVIRRFKYSTTNWCVTRRELVGTSECKKLVILPHVDLLLSISVSLSFKKGRNITVVVSSHLYIQCAFVVFHTSS